MYITLITALCQLRQHYALVTLVLQGAVGVRFISIRQDQPIDELVLLLGFDGTPMAASPTGNLAAGAEPLPYG